MVYVNVLIHAKIPLADVKPEILVWTHHAVVRLIVLVGIHHVDVKHIKEDQHADVKHIVIGVTGVVGLLMLVQLVITQIVKPLHGINNLERFDYLSFF